MVIDRVTGWAAAVRVFVGVLVGVLAGPLVGFALLVPSPVGRSDPDGEPDGEAVLLDGELVDGSVGVPAALPVPAPAGPDAGAASVTPSVNGSPTNPAAAKPTPTAAAAKTAHRVTSASRRSTAPV